MTYEINTSDVNKLSFSGQGPDRIARNVLNLLMMIKYDEAYDRTKGIDDSVFSKPADEMSALVINKAIQIVSQYEPRAKMTDIQFDGINKSGSVNFKVVIEI